MHVKRRDAGGRSGLLVEHRPALQVEDSHSLIPRRRVGLHGHGAGGGVGVQLHGWPAAGTGAGGGRATGRKAVVDAGLGHKYTSDRAACETRAGRARAGYEYVHVEVAFVEIRGERPGSNGGRRHGADASRCAGIGGTIGVSKVIGLVANVLTQTGRPAKCESSDAAIVVLHRCRWAGGVDVANLKGLGKHRPRPAAIRCFGFHVHGDAAHVGRNNWNKSSIVTERAVLSSGIGVANQVSPCRITCEVSMVCNAGFTRWWCDAVNRYSFLTG